MRLSTNLDLFNPKRLKNATRLFFLLQLSLEHFHLRVCKKWWQNLHEKSKFSKFSRLKGVFS
ncbi:hypothetical protein Hanom_Chr12g01131621 [Helianthus anomalus]